jgi:hypothetical protein
VKCETYFVCKWTSEYKDRTKGGRKRVRENEMKGQEARRKERE